MDLLILCTVVHLHSSIPAKAMAIKKAAFNMPLWKVILANSSARNMILLFFLSCTYANRKNFFLSYGLGVSYVLGISVTAL